MAKIKDTLMIKFCIFCCILASFTFVGHAILQNHSSLNVVSEIVFPLNDGWTYSVNDSSFKSLSTLPTSIGSLQRGDEVVIENTLPVAFVDGMSMLFYNEVSSFFVEVDGKMVYSYGDNVNSAVSKSVGSAWHILPLKHEWQGKNISIHYTESYNRKDIVIPEIVVGTYADCTAYFLKNSAFSLFISFCLLVVSLLVLVVFGYIYVQSTNKVYTILYLSLFGIIASMYSFAETDSFQLIFPYPYLIYLMTFLSLPLLAIPLTCYIVDKYRPVHEMALRESIYLLTLNIIIISILPFFGMDLYESIVFTHLSLLVTIIRIGYVILTEVFKYHNKDMYLLGFGGAITIVCGLVNILRYYFAGSTDNAYGLRVAFLILVILLTYKEIKQLSDTEALLQHHNEELRKAHYDFVTGCLVHNQFQYRVAEIQANGTDFTNFVIVVYNLIELTDYENYVTVRKCLCRFVAQMKEVFTDVADVYRVGSTSFALVFESADVIQLSHRIDLLNQNLDSLKKEDPIYEYSYGYEYYSGQEELISVFYRAVMKMNNRAKRIQENKEN